MKYVAIVDDHILIRQGLSALINSFSNYKVLFEADNGKDFIAQLKPRSLPDIVLMDITMPEMDGYDTARWLHNNYPAVKVLALSVLDSEAAIIRMLKSGAGGYLLKNAKPAELQLAMDTLLEKGFYFNDLVSNRLIHSLNKIGDDKSDLNTLVNLSEREIEFLKWVCTEKSYKEIADELCVSPRTIDGYRDQLFEKLGVKTRIGLAMFAIRYNVVTVN
jgi:two-component system, NarL family, invasion response regulator UvrY